MRNDPRDAVALILVGGDSMTTLAVPDETKSASRTESAPQSYPLELSGRVVLLATDESPAAQAATRMAHALAARHGALVHAVSVIDTRSAPIPPPLDLGLAMADATIGAAVQERQVRDLRDAIASTIEQPCDWPVRVLVGIPASAIAKEAAHLGAALIILGLRRHGRLDRAIHDETVLNVMQTSSCPVLGVAQDASDLPTRVLAALDFSVASQEAARAACGVMGANGSIVLAYVPPVMGYLPTDGESVIHELGVKAGFERFAAELARPGVSVDHVVLHHELSHTVASLLLEYADGAHIDLIAAGSARHNRVERWMLGSVSTDLVRDGHRSVLIVPPRGAPGQGDD